MELKRDYQTEYDVLIASFDRDDSRGAQSITEELTKLRALSEPDLERDYQTEYDLLIAASERATGDSRHAAVLAEAINELVGEAEAAGETIAVGSTVAPPKKEGNAKR